MVRVDGEENVMVQEGEPLPVQERGSRRIAIFEGLFLIAGRMFETTFEDGTTRGEPDEWVQGEFPVVHALSERPLLSVQGEEEHAVLMRESDSVEYWRISM